MKMFKSALLAGFLLVQAAVFAQDGTNTTIPLDIENTTYTLDFIESQISAFLSQQSVVERSELLCGCTLAVRCLS